MGKKLGLVLDDAASCCAGAGMDWEAAADVEADAEAMDGFVAADVCAFGLLGVLVVLAAVAAVVVSE